MPFHICLTNSLYDKCMLLLDSTHPVLRRASSTLVHDWLHSGVSAASRLSTTLTQASCTMGAASSTLVPFWEGPPRPTAGGWPCQQAQHNYLLCKWGLTQPGGQIPTPIHEWGLASPTTIHINPHANQCYPFQCVRQMVGSQTCEIYHNHLGPIGPQEHQMFL